MIRTVWDMILVLIAVVVVTGTIVWVIFDESTMDRRCAHCGHRRRSHFSNVHRDTWHCSPRVDEDDVSCDCTLYKGRALPIIRSRRSDRGWRR